MRPEPSYYRALAWPRPNTFEGARLDRVTARRRDPSWVASLAADPASRAVVLSGDAALVDGARLARVPLDGAADPLLLGVQDGVALFAVDGSGRSDLVGLREVAPELAQDEGGLLAYAAALLNWHRRHGFCSVCGTALRGPRGGAACASARRAAPSTIRARTRS